MLLCGLTLMGDGEWLLHFFRQGSPIACHGGSFMPILNDQYCMAATLFPCKQSGNIAMITYCEKMEQEVASNYHGELIGGVIATSILRTLTTLVPNHGQHTYELFCDNMGVVSHGNDIYKPPPERQAQCNLLILLWQNILLSELSVKYTHVYGHLDNDKAFSELSILQQLNVMADKLAKECLVTQVAKGVTWGSTYPHKPVWIWLQGQKITSSIRTALYNDWDSQSAAKLFQRRKIVNHYWFPQMVWEYIGRAMESYPQMFQLWVTKQVLGFNGTNRQLSGLQEDVVNRCPCCGHGDESTAHLTHCTHPGRRKVFQQSVESLLDWMEITRSDISLVECLETYLLAHGEGSMVKIASTHPHLSKWAMELNTLSWDNLLEG